MQVNELGIDVSAATLAVCIQRGQKRHPVATFNNDVRGHRKLLAWATKRGNHARVCLEATGVYSLGLALYFHRHPKIEVMVVNPRSSRHFSRAMMKRAKTDPVDAEVLLEFLQRMPFTPWQPPSDEILQIQAITRRMYQLQAALTREKNRLHSDTYRQEIGTVITNDLTVNIRHLERRLARLENQGLALVASIPELAEKLHHLISVKGIAQTSALRILAEVLVLPDALSPEQWVAQAGLDPQPRESGTSVNKPRFISKAGNKYLRAALYMPALVAIQFEPHVKAFYDKLIQAGKKPKQAIVAVMRKLLRSIWGMLKYRLDFEGDKFYQLA